MAARHGTGGEGEMGKPFQFSNRVRPKMKKFQTVEYGGRGEAQKLTFNDSICIEPKIKSGEVLKWATSLQSVSSPAILPASQPASQPIASQQTANKQPANKQPANMQPANSMPTANSQPTASQPISVWNPYQKFIQSPYDNIASHNSLYEVFCSMAFQIKKQ
jgi:hypothetical protein